MSLSCLLLSSLPAVAEGDAAFARLRESASVLDSLGSFLDKYVGECGDPETTRECSERAKAYRAQITGKKLSMVVSEEAASMLALGAEDARSGEYTFRLTPFFAAGGYAVTQGAPTKTDSHGNPLLPFMSIQGKAPEGGLAPNVARLLSTRQVRVQVIFTPQGTWSLPKKGGGKISGVKAKIDALLVTVARTGETLALWLAK